MPHRVTSSVRTDRKFSEIYFRNSFELSKKSLVTRHWRKWLSIISDGKYVSSFTEYENIFEARRDRPNPEHCGEEKRYLKRLAPPGARRASRYHKRNSTNWSFNVRPYPGYRYAVVKAVKAWKSTHSPGTNERRSVSTQFVMFVVVAAALRVLGAFHTARVDEFEKVCNQGVSWTYVDAQQFPVATKVALEFCSNYTFVR